MRLQQPQSGILPGFEAYFPTKWNVPVSPETTDLGKKEKESLTDIAKNSVLALSETQITAIEDFIQVISNETSGTLGGIPAFSHLARVSVIDYKDCKGGRCQIALQMGVDSHLIRYGYEVELTEKDLDEKSRVIFGITCLGHVKGLSKEEISLVKGLDRWVKGAPVLWLKNTFKKAIKDSLTIDRAFQRWINSIDSTELQTALQMILSDPNRLAVVYNGKRAIQFAGRTLAACKAASFLMQNRIPVPHEIVRRVLLGAKKLR